MSQSCIITALDIGTTKVCAMIANVTDHKPEIIGVGVSPCTGLKKGLVTDIYETTASIKDAVWQAEKISGVKADSVYVGITGEHITSMNSKSVIAISNPDGMITKDDLEQLLNSAKSIVIPPDREIIHIIPRSYTLDGQKHVKSPVGMHATRLEVEVHIVTGLSSFIQNVVKCVNQAGLTVDHAVLEPIATAESVLFPAEKEIGAALVDIGGGTTDIVIYTNDKILFSAVIPLGGNHVTRDISIGLRTDNIEAERIKLAHGSVSINDSEPPTILKVQPIGCEQPRLLPGKILSEIIEPRMSEMCRFVLDQIENAGYIDKIPAGIVFTGGGSMLPGFCELAAEMSGLPIRIGKPAEISGLTDEMHEPIYSTAVGLVIHGSKHCRKHAPEFLGMMNIKKIYEQVRDYILEIYAKIRGD
ncbi:MAG: cell division protein FtsA [Armatimonadota bacterium]